MAHYITSLTFGDESVSSRNLPGNFNPLARRDNSGAQAAESHDYTMKIVPTIYEDASGNSYVSYQYTYALSVISRKTFIYSIIISCFNILLDRQSYVSFTLGGRSPPAIWFRYDLNPITVKYHEKRQPIYSFLTSVTFQLPSFYLYIFFCILSVEHNKFLFHFFYRYAP